jgi:hypothetical protein
MISKYCKKLKYQRRIVLVTDGKGLMDSDGAAEISKKIRQEGIELIVVYAKEFEKKSILISTGAWISTTLSMVTRKRTRSLKRFPVIVRKGDFVSADISSPRLLTRRLCGSLWTTVKVYLGPFNKLLRSWEFPG